MIVVGLTGGIASGKSFVAKYLKKNKIPVHESDQVVFDLYRLFNKDLVNFLLKNGFKKSISKKKLTKIL